MKLMSLLYYSLFKELIVCNRAKDGQQQAREEADDTCSE